MNKFKRGAWLILAALLLSAPGLGADDGTHHGVAQRRPGCRPSRRDGHPDRPALQGAQTQVTDQDGAFRFLSVPPGRYTVKIELAGFKTIEQSDVQVGIDRAVDLVLTMQVAGLAETVTVTSISPTVDTTSTAIGVNANADLFERLPVRRDMYAIARIAPGTTEDSVGPAVLGSTGAENQYIIEGLNTTGIEKGQRTKQLNFDFVEEIELKTGGLHAEYGRMTGGVINVITKSGGNVFSGSVYAFNEGGKLMSNDSTEGERPQTTTTVQNLDSRGDVGFNLAATSSRTASGSSARTTRCSIRRRPASSAP